MNTQPTPTRLRSVCTRLALAGLFVLSLDLKAAEPERRFTPLLLVPTPKIVSSADAYPGGQHKASNLTDALVRTEYSSDGKGTNTFVEFEFAVPMRLAAFRHVDRNDPATVASSELIFADADSGGVTNVPVTHANTRGGVTFFTLPVPIRAQRVKWQVTGLGPQGFGTVGGAEIEFFAAGLPETGLRRTTLAAKAIPVLERRGLDLVEPLRLTINYPYAESVDALVRLGNLEPKPVQLQPGTQTLEFSIAPVEAETALPIALEAVGQTVTRTNLLLKPVRRLVAYILPHSHTDIGYTEIQTAIEKKQVNNLLQGIEYARKTASYPEGARFVWNVEVLWAADLYLRRLTDAQRADFLDAVKKGQVALNGMYLNELTGLCRPEELLQLFRYSTKLAEQCGTTIDSAMISDVPGYTWGTVTAMAQAGIKYFSAAPNYFDRIGDILVQWENRPFYWLSPSGQERVLVWIPYMGYAMSHLVRELTPKFVEDYLAHLEKTAYPYDIAYMRWSGHGDNAVPDPAICEFVKGWNAKYASPHFIISSTSEAFRAFEGRYGNRIPDVRGDWTPYWEDGAASSAAETALNRASSDRLVQAEALFAMLNPAAFPAADFEDAWRNVLLYSEHTWGADCSVSDPESQKTKEQWDLKQSYALQADKQSQALLRRALPAADAAASGFDLFNTTSWSRNEIAVVSRELSTAGDLVKDDKGRALPSQRLSNGELALLAREVPPFGARRYTVSEGHPPVKDVVIAQGATLDNGMLHVRVDERTGAIVELRAKGIEGNLVDSASGHGINDFLFLPGENLGNLLRNGPVKISVKETGPLVASLLIESDAPICNKLSREVRLVAGSDYLELIDTVDKKRAEIPSRPGDWQFAQKGGKESLNFAFPFNVPNADMVLDLPLGAMRPELDQMPSACKNWFTVGRWADVANADFGVTLVTLDVPLFQVGGLTANLTGSQTNPNAWRKHVARTGRLYAWAMNNHWHTNYRAYQEGPVVFRFILRPHGPADRAETARFATGLSQPLLATRAASAAPAKSLLRVEPASVVVTALKPSDDGRALIVRLFGASGRPEQASLRWSDAAPKSVSVSDTSEKPGAPVSGPVTVPAWGLVTLRVERP